MVLENMVDADDVDDELEAEVADECRKFGRVTRISVSCEQRDDSYELPESCTGDVRVFVEFASQSGSRLNLGWGLATIWRGLCPPAPPWNRHNPTIILF